MIEELSDEPLHVCVCCDGKPSLFVAHCGQLDLIGEGSTEDEAISRLKKTIEIQYHIYEDKDSDFWAQSEGQWLECHQAAPLGSPEDSDFVIERRRRANSSEVVNVQMKIDKTCRIITNKDSWCEEYPLNKLMKILSTKRISWRPSEEVDYGYFFGHWPAGSDGPLQSYTFHAPPDAMVRWYHLRSIASRFGLDDLREMTRT